MSDMSASDSSSDDDDDEALEQEITQLRATILSNPHSYDSHIALIVAQRKAGDLDGVRSAREAMSAVFPLTLPLWTSWLADEARLADTPNEHASVLALYGRAVEDYLSVPLWLTFCEYAERVHGDDASDSTRKVYESALAAAGAHLPRGGEVWAAFRAFERRVNPTDDGRVRALYRRQLRLPLANLASVANEYRSLLSGGDGSGGSGLGGDTALEHDYNKALKGADARARFENALIEEQFSTTPSPAQLAPWLDYAAFEAKQRDAQAAQRVQCVYERAVACWPLSSELWRAYITSVGAASASSSGGAVPTAVYRRAVRNISWSGALWCSYLRGLMQEAPAVPSAQIEAAFRLVDAAQLGSPEEVSSVALVQCAYRRSALEHATKEHAKAADTSSSSSSSSSSGAQSQAADVSKAQQALEAAFTRACGKLRSLDPAAAGGAARIAAALAVVQRVWAAACARPGSRGGLGDPSQARALWDGLLADPDGALRTQASAWLECIALERRVQVGGEVRTAQWQHVARVHALFGKALTVVADNPVLVCESWLGWAREDATLAQTLEAEAAVAARYGQLSAAYAVGAAAAANATTAAASASSGAEKKGKKRKQPEAASTSSDAATSAQPAGNNAGVVAGARGSGYRRTDDGSALVDVAAVEELLTQRLDAKLGRDYAEADRLRVELSKLNVEVFDKEKSWRAIPPKAKAVPKGGVVGLPSRGKDGQAFDKRLKGAGGGGSEGGKRKPPQATKSKGKINHDHSIFVKNLPFDMSEDAVQALFEEAIGPIVQARLILRAGSGKSRGFGYVEFVDPLHVEAAVTKGAERTGEGEADQDGATGGFVVNGRRLNVSASNLAEAILAEQAKKEQAEQQRKKKHEETADNTEPTRKPRLIGLPRALRGKAVATRPTASAGQKAAGPRSNADFAAMFKKKPAVETPAGATDA